VAGSQSQAESEETAVASIAPAAAAPGVISSADLVARLESDDVPVILDVRSPEEYSAGHIPGAINVPYDQISAHLDSLGAFRGREIVVYCRSGRRAGIAETALVEAGFSGVLDLDGHMQSWAKSEHPVVVPAGDCC
jgi:rhodanese-related sulfurtransferase